MLTLEHLRSVVGFRGYAQRDPLNEYKTESFQLFESMLDSLRNEVTQKLAQVRPMTEDEQRSLAKQMAAQQSMMEMATDKAAAQTTLSDNHDPVFDETDSATWGNPGRNESCPCGSGKKFKHCHGRI